MTGEYYHQEEMKNFDQNNFLHDLSQVDWDMLVESSHRIEKRQKANSADFRTA